MGGVIEMGKGEEEYGRVDKGGYRGKLESLISLVKSGKVGLMMKVG